LLGYYLSTGSVSTALSPELTRDLVELSFIENYGWTPDYIASLPYKWIQKHNFMKRMKGAAIETRNQQQKLKTKMAPMKPGQKRIQEM